VKLLNSAAFGPSHDYPQFDVNWTRRMYEHQGRTVYLDRTQCPDLFEIFIAADNLCFIGEFSVNDWHTAEKRAERLVDNWIENGYRPRDKATRYMVLDFIKACIQNDGHSPTLQEIADAMCITSPSAFYHVDILDRLGKIRRVAGPRGIRLTERN